MKRATMSTISTTRKLSMKAVFLTVLISVIPTYSMAASKHEELSGPAKDFTLRSNKNKNIRLNDLRGQVVMINFWASWCAPCRQEMPLLDKLYQRYNAAGFELLGINTDEDQAEADKVLKKTPVSFPILFDSDNAVSELYKNDAMPMTVLVDCDGNLNYLHRGYKAGDEKTYKKRVKKLLASCK